MFDRKTYNREYYSKQRNQRKAEGRCVTCGATLTAECTTLQCERCREKQKYAMVAKVNIQKLIAEAKTDTVRRMQERLQETIADLEYKASVKRKTVTVETLIEQVNWVLHEILPERIDQIAKEMLEGPDEQS